MRRIIELALDLTKVAVAGYHGDRGGWTSFALDELETKTKRYEALIKECHAQ